MKMIPIFYCSDMKESISFYTNILDFQLKEEGVSLDDWVINLVNGDAELMLTRLEGDQVKRVNVNVTVVDIDQLFKKYTARGLDQSGRKESPVHLAPVDQSWGNREFYVTDRDGNTLRFIQRP